MCGIVGYSGNNEALKVVLEGLTRLEYRGYDSAGISFQNENEFSVIKREGKLQNLKSTLIDKNIDTSIVIGHTRWATHGVVNQENAHPHANDLISLVHNGIVENADELRSFLKTEGYSFTSQTDTEVFLVLLTKYFKELGDIKLAIGKAFTRADGNSAFVIMVKGDDHLYAIKRSAPLVCGLDSSKKVTLLSSDPYALVGYADQLFFPENEVICVAGSDGHMSFYEVNGSASKRFVEQAPNMSLDMTTKGDFEHFMLKEIYEQPQLIKRLGQFYLEDMGASILKQIDQYEIEHIYIAACGTAWHAGLVIRNFIEELVGIRVSVELASEFRYKKNIYKKGDIALFISQSGETADTLACQELCKEKGLPCFSIVNVEGSTLYRHSDINFPILAGKEVGVASTKAFTQQCLTGYIFAEYLSGNKKLSKVKDNLELLSSRIQGLLDSEDKTKSLEKIAENIYLKKGFLFTGRGAYWPIALEGALKLKEIAYVHAEGYAAGELKHGPIALIDEEMVNIALIGPELFDKTLSNAQEIKARRGYVITVGEKIEEKSLSVADDTVVLDFKEMNLLKPILANVVMQIMTYQIAKIKGTDIDKPRNLAKSVTVE